MKKHSIHEIENALIALTKKLLAESGEPYAREIKLDASLYRHLGIDSLGRAELFQRIEKTFAVNMPDNLLAEAETLQDIANYLATAHPTIKKSLTKNIVTSHGDYAQVNPSQAKTLIELLYLYAETVPNKPHIYFQLEDGHEEVITYQDLLKASLRVAQGLREHGLREGETVAIMQPTHPGFFYIFFGTLLAGGVPVPIYPPFRAHMIEAYAKTEAHILKSAQVRVLVTFTQAEKLSYLLQGFVPSLKVVTTVDELLKSSETKKPFHANKNHFAFIQYTSGSTSNPKGVLLAHRNLMANIEAYGKGIQIKPDDVAVSWLPLYHDLGLIGMWLGSLYHGIPLILMTPFTFLNRPERWLWAIHYHRGTLSGAPNFAYELCVRKIDPSLIEGLDLSSWRMAANGAEKIYPRTLRQFADKFAPYGFKRSALFPVYGLAESTVGLTLPPVDREFKVDTVARKAFEEERLAKAGSDENTLEFVSCGMAIEGHDIRIVDDKGKVLPERHVGNLQFTGPSNMQGYYNNPTATAAVYHDGWIDTGDLAYIADKELYITGRHKDLIIKAGRNLYPAEIEELVGNVPGVRQGCVTAFGVTDHARGTEQLIVVAETRETDKNKRASIRGSIKDTISAALDLVPDRVVLVAPKTVPKTSSGKLQRAACKQLYLQDSLNKKHIPAWLQITKLSAQWSASKFNNALNVAAKLLFTTYVASVLLLTAPFIYFIVCLVSRSIAVTICKAWATFIRLIAFCPMTVIGKEYLTQKNTVIYAANHASYIDSIILLSLLPKTTRFVGKKELLSTPILRTFMRKLNYLPVDRFDISKGIEDTKEIESALKAGHPILIFPEGTFGYASGLRPFRLGAFKLAIETQTSICPIALQGTRLILRGEEKLMRPARIQVTITEPIAPQGTEWHDVTQLRNQVRAEIAKHCGEPSLDFIAAQKVAPRT